MKIILMALLFYPLMGLSALLQIQVIKPNSDIGMIFSYVIGVLLSALIIVFIMRRFLKANYRSIACVAMLASIPYITFTAKLIPLWPGVSTSSIVRTVYEVLVIYLSFGMAYLAYNLIQANKEEA